MDILDASILNIALPSIKSDLGFSQQSLQWVVERLHPHLRRLPAPRRPRGRPARPPPRARRGLVVFAGSSLIGGLAHTSALLVGARFAQGVGAAMMSPAALSTLTSTFRSTRDRNTALGVVGGRLRGSAAPPASSSAACSPRGRAGAGCCSSTSPSARSPSCGAFALLSRERRAHRTLANFDALGALLVTGGMLLLVYSLVKAPDVGWGTARTIAGLAGSAVLLAAFVVNELRVAQPARPALDPAGQGSRRRRRHPAGRPRRLPADVLLPHPLHADRARLLADPDGRRLPAADRWIHHRRRASASQLFARIGTKPVVVLGTVIAAGGLYWLSQIPVDGSYLSDILPGLLVVSHRRGRRLHRA